MDRFYSIKQAAEALGKSRPTVYRMIKDGELKVQTFAGKPAIAIREIERMQRSRKEAK
jgi:excisionase family DNA binding protein